MKPAGSAVHFRRHAAVSAARKSVFASNTNSSN
jgi:hypothetical protein